MKTTRFLNMMAASLVGVAFMSCSSQDDVLTPAGQTYTMSVTAQKGGDGTRALSLSGEGNKTLNATWTAGDEVEVWTADGTTKKYGTLTAQSDGASTTLSGSLDELPSNGTLTLKYLSPSYSQQDGTLTGSANSIDKVCDYATATVTATVSGTNVTTGAAEFQNQQAVVKFTLTDNAATPNAIKPTALTINDGTDDIVKLTDIPAETYTANGEGVLYVAIPGFTGKTITLTATVGSDTYTCTTSEAKTLENGKYYGVTAKMTKQAAAPAGAEAVDLGLSVKWANMNVGAASVGDYGQFFAWGETTGYGSNTGDGHNFGWASYSLCGGSNTTLTKYNNDGNKGTVDNKTTLEAADDAATQNWGGDWRMPTYDELNELLATKSNANYTWEWTTVGGHNGYKITYTSTGANIFLPASGGREADFLYSQGTYGYYWSSSLSEFGAQEGSYLTFKSNSAGMGSTYRYSGYSVRPVQGAPAPAVPAGALNGEFSVSATKTVKFSKGNLRYASGTWSFFDNQYDYYTSYSADAWDKFGWSTSATTYGMNTSNQESDYLGDFVDWGSNSDLQTALGTGWFTLSSDEWKYLFYTRSASTVGGTSNGRYAKAKVNDVQGMILFPDTYTHPDGVTAPIGVNAAGNTGWNGNSYTAADWTKMESAGCVFLPAAGDRYGSSAYNLGTTGYYWSATPLLANYALRVRFYSGDLYSAEDHTRNEGYSVRLVREVE